MHMNQYAIYTLSYLQHTHSLLKLFVNFLQVKDIISWGDSHTLLVGVYINMIFPEIIYIKNLNIDTEFSLLRIISKEIIKEVWEDLATKLLIT